MSEGRSAGFTAGSVPEAYDRFMAPQLFEPWARELVGRAELRSGSSVLDVASGPGTVARLAAAVVGPDGRVVASDISPAMLAVAAAKPVDPAWAPIDYLECPVTAIDAAEGSFDAVLCQQRLQFFPDRGRAVGEMCRVARPGGVVMVSTWASERPPTAQSRSRRRAISGAASDSRTGETASSPQPGRSADATSPADG